ncbi:MAG: hypothetical protein FWJ93_04885 [Micromonosporaceae bacterium]
MGASPLVARLLRTRYVVALLLAVAVFATVGIARLIGPSAGPGGLRGSGVETAATVNPTTGDDGEASVPGTPSPATSPGAAGPEQVGEAFVAAWLDHRGVDPATWFSRLRPYLTPSLARRMTESDPASVPADRVTGAAQLVARSESFVEVTVPIDAGLLRLRLVATDGRWLVDVVDWERR